MRRAVAYAMAAACLLAACGKAGTRGPGVPAEATRTAAALTGDDKGEPSDNPQCKLFTGAEVAQYIGEPVAGPHNAAMGTGCQWMAADGTGQVLVQVVRAKDHNPPKLADGFRKAPEVGEGGFVVAQMGGWQAGESRGPRPSKS